MLRAANLIPSAFSEKKNANEHLTQSRDLKSYFSDLISRP